MEHYHYGLQLALLIIFITIGAGIIYGIKNINYGYKFLIFIVLLNLLLTIFLPNYSLVSMLSMENQFINPLSIKNIEASTVDYWSIRGQIGDLIAGHFTALAFIGLLISISQMRISLEKQDKAIKIQQREMRNQQKEMKATTESLKLQAKLIEK